MTNLAMKKIKKQFMTISEKKIESNNESVICEFYDNYLNSNRITLWCKELPK